MKQYGYDEIQQMQEKALERVREMNLQARSALEEPTERETKVVRPASPPTHKGHIPMPVNIQPSRNMTQEPPKAVQKHTGEGGIENILSDVFDEPDKALLLSLLLLFKGDKANEELMMALIYIMMS